MGVTRPVDTMRSSRLVPVVATILLLALAACGGDREERSAAPETRHATADAEEDIRLPAAADPDGTARALESGVARFTAEFAIRNIDAWLARLEDASFERRDQIVGGLEELRTALQETAVDGRRLGGIMRALGENTSRAGADAGHAQVERLGQVLMQSGDQLIRGEVDPGAVPAATPRATPIAPTEGAPVTDDEMAPTPEGEEDVEG
jgi:hypothetical protein